MGFIFNFIKRIIKLCIKLTLYLAIFASLIVFIPNLPPYTKFTSIEISLPQARVGALAPNNALNNVQYKYKGKLLGPEAFQVFNGELYTGVATGEIVKLSPGGHVTFVTKLGLPCSGLLHEHICGRPLGFQIDDKSNTMYVADAYHGIWKVDLKTDKKQLLVSPRVEIGKRAPKLFNSLALDKNGGFYWTDSTSDFYLKDGTISMLSDPSGRVFHYDAAKNQSKVLIDDIWFANGLVLSPNNDFLVIAESNRFRLLKHYVSGPKKGKTEVLVDGLPGIPDNLRVLPDGSGVLVALYTVFDEENPLVQRSLARTPLVRKFLARVQRLIEVPFEYLNTIYPHIIFEEIVYHIGHFKSVSGLVPPSSGLVQVGWDGKIVASYFNTDKSIAHISDVVAYNGELYMGNPHVQDFIGAVPLPPSLKIAFETVKKTEAPKAETKPHEAKVKTEEKPMAQPKPNTERVKPKVEQKPKVDAKPKVEEKKPIVPEKKEPQKTTNANNKHPQENKPTQPVKDTQQVPKKSTPTPTPQPTTPPPKTNIPKTTSQQQTTTPKPTPPQKPTEQAKPPPPKTTTKKTEPKNAQETTKTPSSSEIKEQIPIKEDIPSDTAQPPRETLKVIKKGGVKAEIPVPNNL